MSYYDDLGVAQDATLEQIRDSYRTLVRLLHPDRHSDPALKGTAEGQLRRINRIAEVLLDPERRRTYDAELSAAEQRTQPIIIERLPQTRITRFRAGTLAWGIAALASVGMIFWLSSQGEPLIEPLESIISRGENGARRNSATEAGPARNAASESAKVQELRRELRQARIERDEAVALLTGGVRPASRERIGEPPHRPGAPLFSPQRFSPVYEHRPS